MEKMQFKAESQRLLDLMINSIYTHKEIFLREIISNASDAMDKLAYLAVTDGSMNVNRDDLKITITRDKDARTLTVSDNGIGMNKDEMEENLGTICKSGSLGFKQAMEKNEDIDIIGQFGVGFYSAFMVASSVTVISKKWGEDTAWKWVSDGADGYTIEPCEREGSGTDVIMTLKEDTEDEKYSTYLDEYEIRNLIKKYSDYIRYPIVMEVEKSRKKEDSPEDKPEYETYNEMETSTPWCPSGSARKRMSPKRNTTPSTATNSTITQSLCESSTPAPRAALPSRHCCLSPAERPMISTPRTLSAVCSCTPPVS